MLEAKIIDRGRGPEIAGTRITVYTILECQQDGWRPDLIAFWYHLRDDQVDAAIRYIEEHRAEVTADYRKIMDRIERGNPPELQAKLDAAHERLQAMVRLRRLSRAQVVGHDGHSGGQ
jgi:uncharacterized protein (DUF433 family)